MKNIAILGSTGSIGTQTLEVIEANPELFQVEVLTAYNNVDLLIAQSLKFKPNMVVIVDEDKYTILRDALEKEDIKVYAGKDALVQIVEASSIDIVVAATVGYSGLIPVINAIKANKIVALANKETLVVGGELITRLLKESSAAIIPVDSEHSAIFQCLVGEGDNKIEEIILTASGGPFRGKDRDYLRKVTPAQALKHPNWDMGAKVTIDSASLMNKGFEMIEAHWFFGVAPRQIKPIIHPQSIVHSMVQFSDGSIKAQLGIPDMRLPIQYALTYPDRIYLEADRVDFVKLGSLTFEEPDRKTFLNLDLAYKAIEKGGNLPCILNAANEIAVEMFLKEEISFTGMSTLIEETMNKVDFISNPQLEDYVETDKVSRKIAKELAKLPECKM
ncbi:MAG: 1-deoxy-D-xylulose-5-phosphate reductoisomerase [Odoribacter sp.]|nr:1-deoxy-D-xylulose-5-phosphate reductoisomerase [Odoribacter sp.]